MGTKFLAGLIIISIAMLMVSSDETALAGTRCPDIDINDSTYKVGTVKADCDTAARVIEMFFVRYENQTGIQQVFWVEGFRCGRASGTLGCQNKSGTKGIFAGSHVGDKPWTWKPTPPISKAKRDCGVPRWSKIKRGGKLKTQGGVTCVQANRRTLRYLRQIQDANSHSAAEPPLITPSPA